MTINGPWRLVFRFKDRDAHNVDSVDDRQRSRCVIFQEVHPGRILKRELEARGLSAAVLALKLRIAPQRVQEIVTRKRAISPETALRLGRFFSNEPEFWLAMQASYDLAMVRGTVGPKIETEVEIAARSHPETRQLSGDIQLCTCLASSGSGTTTKTEQL